MTGIARRRRQHERPASHAGDSGYYFPETYADAGGNANVTVGASGVWVFPITVLGNFTNSGPDAGSASYVSVLQNGQYVEDSSSFYTPAYTTFEALNTISNGCTGASWAEEMVGWGATLSNLHQDTSSADLSHSILWRGPGYVIGANGSVNNNITITSDSGFDFNAAASDTAALPGPSSLSLVAAAGISLAIATFRRRRNNVHESLSRH